MISPRDAFPIPRICFSPASVANRRRSGAAMPHAIRASTVRSENPRSLKGSLERSLPASCASTWRTIAFCCSLGSRIKCSHSRDLPFLVASRPVRDLLLCAKHLFVEATQARPTKGCHGGLSGRSTRYNKVTRRLHWDPVSDSGPILKHTDRDPVLSFRVPLPDSWLVLKTRKDSDSHPPLSPAGARGSAPDPISEKKK